MQSFWRSLIRRQSSHIAHFRYAGASLATNGSNIHWLTSLESDSSILHGVIASNNHFFRSFHQLASLSSLKSTKIGSVTDASSMFNLSLWTAAGPPFLSRTMTTAGNSAESAAKVASEATTDGASRIKFKRLDKTARHIMQILDKEAVQEVRAQREIPDIKPVILCNSKWYSPNIKEIKVLDKKKVRRAKLYYLRDKMNALNK